jgi:Leucine-rich repeat (LRR) protein
MTEEILTSVVTSPSANTLSILYLEANQLKQIPKEIRSLPKITDLYLVDNNITFIGKGSLSFSASWLTQINLSNISLNVIEPGAFQGIAYIF